MSGVSREVVFSVGSSLLMDYDGKARTQEIVNADRVIAKETQVRKALDALEERGFTRYEKEGRSAYWVVENDSSLFKFLVSEEVEEEFNSYEDRLVWCRRNL